MHLRFNFTNWQIWFKLVPAIRSLRRIIIALNTEPLLSFCKFDHRFSEVADWLITIH